MSLFDSRQPKDIFRQHPNKNSSLAILDFLENDVVDPSINLLKDKRNSIDIEKKKHLHSLLEFVELLVITIVLHNFELIIPTGIAMNYFSLWWLVFCFLIFLIQILLLFVETFAPTSVGNVILTLFILQHLWNEFCIFFAQFVNFRLVLLHQLHPIIQRWRQKVENKFRVTSHCFFAQFVWKNLVEVLRLELFILISIPDPYLGINALHIFLLLILLVLLAGPLQLVQQLLAVWEIIFVHRS